MACARTTRCALLQPLLPCSLLLPSLLWWHGKARKSFPNRVPLHQAGSKWDSATVATTSATEEETECNLKIEYGLQMKSDIQTAKNCGRCAIPSPTSAPNLHKGFLSFSGAEAKRSNSGGLKFAAEFAAWFPLRRNHFSLQLPSSSLPNAEQVLSPSHTWLKISLGQRQEEAATFL